MAFASQQKLSALLHRDTCLLSLKFAASLWRVSSQHDNDLHLIPRETLRFYCVLVVVIGAMIFASTKGCLVLTSMPKLIVTVSNPRFLTATLIASAICCSFGSIFLVVSIGFIIWQARRDSNSQHAVLETAVLPLELRTYK